MIRLFVVIWIGGLFVACNSSNKSAQNEEQVEVNPEIDAIHHAGSSIDWAGSYQGELPCEDCDGIDMEVTINNDNTFVLRSVKKGKDEVIEEQGEIAWADNESYITLRGTAVDHHFRVGENHLTFLVEGGSTPEDALLDVNDYVLEKVEQFSTPSSVPPPTPRPESRP